MEKLYEELDKAKFEIEKLKAECRSKSELYESLKRAYDEQQSKLADARLEITKQTQELSEKADEAFLAKKDCEDLKGSLRQKESIIKRLRTANDKIRVDCDAKLQTWDEEKRGLVLALDEANEKIAHLEQNIRAFKAEVEELKGHLSASQTKLLEVEGKTKAAYELRRTDDLLSNLEEQQRKVEDQLKWKIEQFTHLEEAHKKLREQFKESKKDWGREKSAMVDEISSLQSQLDLQTRISEDLQNKLQVCNHALAHEESRRKYLEIQVSDFQTRYETAVAECHDAKSKVEFLTSQRDNEIASLRNALGQKETLYKEMEYRAGRLELENQELLMSVKELQEAGIQKGKTSSVVKLQSKLRHMQQIHNDCAATLRAKEGEWNSRLEEMTTELNKNRSELKNKEKELEQLKFEVEDSHSSNIQLTLEYEENHMLLLVLKSWLSEAKLGIKNCADEKYPCEKEWEEKVSYLMKQLEVKNSALVKAETDLKEEHEKVKSLLREVGCLKLVEEERSLMQKQAESYKELLEESSKFHFHLKNKLVETEIESREKLSKVSNALDKINSELAEKFCESTEVQLEIWIWKSIAEQLKSDLEENHEIRKQLEASLHAQVEAGKTVEQDKSVVDLLLKDKDKRICSLQQHLVLMEKELEVKQAETSSDKRNAVMSLESQRLKHIQILKEKDEILEDLQEEIKCLEVECISRELESAVIAHRAAEGTFLLEKENLVQLVEEREKREADLLQLLGSMEVKLNNTLMSSSLEIAEKQTEIDLFHEAWEKITAAYTLAKLEIEDKNLMVNELEENICDIQKRLNLIEKSLGDSKQKALEAEAIMKTELSEAKELASQLELKLKASDALIDELKNEKKKLLEEINDMSSEKAMAMSFIRETSDKISKFSDKDMQLMESLERIMQSFDSEHLGHQVKEDILFAKSVKDSVQNIPVVTMNSEAFSEERSPLRERNYC